VSLNHRDNSEEEGGEGIIIIPRVIL